MIPTIEQIIEDLVAGTISKSQAITWLYEHAEGSANNLRDHFAGQAMQGLITCECGLHDSAFSMKDGFTIIENYAFCAYDYADAMIKARDK